MILNRLLLRAESLQYLVRLASTGRRLIARRAAMGSMPDTSQANRPAQRCCLAATCMLMSSTDSSSVASIEDRSSLTCGTQLPM